MRVVSGRRSLGRDDRPSDAPRTDEPVLDWDEATTISPVADFDVMSSDGMGADTAPAADIDADTVLDDRSLDEILTFALGTDERPFPQQLERIVPRPPTPAPALPQQPPSRAFVVPTIPPPPIVRPQTLPPPVNQAVDYPVAIPAHMAPSQPYPLQVPPTGSFPHADLSHGYPLQQADLSHGYPLQQVDLSQGYPLQQVDLSQAHVLQSPPVTAQSIAARWGIPAMALLGIAATGLALGKIMFDDGDAPPPRAPLVAAGAQTTAAAPAPAPTLAPAPAPAAPTLTTPAPTAPVPDTSPAPASDIASAAPITAEVASLVHPATAAVLAPARGTVTEAYLTGSRRVKVGDKLFQITTRSAGGDKERQLAAKVAELERLAAQDPVYQEFLERARRERDRARGRTESVIVRATGAGIFEATVARGDRVELRQPLASRSDTRIWTARVNLRGKERPGTRWSCAITPAAGDSGGKKVGRCTIEQIVDDQDGVEVTVRVDARAAPWLESLENGHRLIFEPPPTAD